MARGCTLQGGLPPSAQRRVGVVSAALISGEVDVNVLIARAIDRLFTITGLSHRDKRAGLLRKIRGQRCLSNLLSATNTIAPDGFVSIAKRTALLDHGLGTSPVRLAQTRSVRRSRV